MYSVLGIPLYFLAFFVGWNLTSVRAIEHASNLIWAQAPHSPSLALSRLVGISGDPSEWVVNKNPQVNNIAAPHFTWVFTSLGFNWQDQAIYWSERTYKKIQRLTLNGSTETSTLYTGTSAEVGGLAVDWLSRNLYFTDSLYDSILMIPSCPGRCPYRIVVNHDLHSPHGIAVHPAKGRLFWSDWGAVPRIETSDLLGQGRRTLFQARDIVKPKGLAIDFRKERVYWVDASKATIESVTLDGLHREVLQPRVPNAEFYGLALYGDYFFVTDRGRQSMLKVFKGIENVINFKLNDPPYDMTMYDESQQPGSSSACEEKQCEQFCVLDPVKGPMCYCGDEFYLDTSDNKSCIVTNRFVHPSHIYAIRDSICKYPANMPDMSLQKVNMNTQCFLSERQGHLSLTFDARSNMLYYFANMSKVISRLPLEAKGVAQVLAGGGGVVNGMSYDWVHDLLFWADTTNGIIYMCAKDCSYQTSVIKNLASPFAIVVHPERGMLFWTSQGNELGIEPSVECSFMDGSERKDIMRDGLGIVTHMHMDYRKDVLYWADMGLNHVRSYDLDTKEIKVFFQLSGVKFYGISLFKDYILWTDRDDQNGLHAARLDTGEKVRGIIHPKSGLSSDLITFDQHNQPIKNGSSPFINPCSQIYQKLGPNGFRCACGNGYRPGVVNTTQCVSTVAVDNFLLVNDAYQRQIFQIDLQTGDVDGLKVKSNNEPIALTFNPYDYRIFWSNNKAHTIMSAMMKSGESGLVTRMSSTSVCDGLAVDYINKLLFYTDAGNDVIGAISLTNYDLQTIVVDSDLGEPRDIVLSPNEGIMYWSDWGVIPRIERASMDGSGREVVVNLTLLAWPNGLALDVSENMLYWACAYTDSINVIDLGTKKVTTLIEEEGSHYFSIQVIGQYIYVSDWTRNFIVRMNKRGGSMKRFGNLRFTKMYGIQGFNSTEKFTGQGACSSHSCDHLCLPKGKVTYSCVCSDGYTPVGDKCVVPVGHTTAEPEVIVTVENVSNEPVSLGYPSTSPSPAGLSTSSATTTTTTTTTSTTSDTSNEPGSTRAAPRARKSSDKSSEGLSPLLIGVICAAAVIAIIVVAAVVLRRRYLNKSGHWRLHEDRTPVSVAYHDSNADSISFDNGGIANPTYDYLHNMPSPDGSND